MHLCALYTSLLTSQAPKTPPFHAQRGRRLTECSHRLRLRIVDRGLWLTSVSWTETCIDNGNGRLTWYAFDCGLGNVYEGES